MTRSDPLPLLRKADTTTWQRFAVDYAYPVSFTENLFCTSNRTLLDTLCLRETDRRHRVSVIIDAGVVQACPALSDEITAYSQTFETQLSLVAKPLVVAAGEALKSSARPILALQKAVADQRIDRHSFIIGIGGGALLDAVGLVAATSHRGIRHIRIPTTVLAQNDSGVGVKNGINLFGQKNYLGSFAPPFAVLNDYRFISVLPERDKIAGMAEAVKVALIRDLHFFSWLEQNSDALRRFDKAAMQWMIRRCAELHMHQIASGGDPFETGSARPLDFGHWSAHRLETLTRHEIRHGEAVAIGLALDTRYSVLCGLLQAGVDDRVCTLLEKLGFSLWHPALRQSASDGQPAILQGLTDFQEHLGGELTITLLESPGRGIEVHDMDYPLLISALDWLQARRGHAHEDGHGHEHEHEHDKRSSCGKDCSTCPGAAMDRTRTVNSAVNPAVSPAVDAAVEAAVLHKGGPEGEAVHDRLDTRAVAEHLHHWLENRLERDGKAWLDERLHMLENAFLERDLQITLGLIPRKLGRDDLQVSGADIDAARMDCGRDWDPSDWSLDTAARCLVLITLLHSRAADFDRLLTDLCQSADLNESIACYRCTAVLPQSAAMDELLGNGLRSHIRALFEAVAHRNPYPQLHFDQHRFNHMVLKALFVGSCLWPIQGIDERGNPELATVLCDYAHERWAANRRISPELWRCVGPHASGALLDDLQRTLSSDDALEQQAGLLALLSCPAADHADLRRRYPAQCADINAGLVSWESIGRALSADHTSSQAV